MNALLVNDGLVLQITAAATHACGDLLQLDDGRAGVVQGLNPEATGGRIAVLVQGLFDVDCAEATVFAAGQAVYWDAANELAVTAPVEGGFFLGAAQAEVDNATDVVRVALNVAPVLTGTPGGSGTIITQAVLVDHADTELVEVISAAQNDTGLVLLAAYGEVVEVAAGGTEDQLIAGVFEEDNATAKSTITAANASADTIGDVIKGTAGALTASDGAVLGKIAAGKAVLVGVSQAATGSGAAGKFRVRAIFAVV